MGEFFVGEENIIYTSLLNKAYCYVEQRDRELWRLEEKVSSSINGCPKKIMQGTKNKKNKK